MATPTVPLTLILPYAGSARRTLLRVRACMRYTWPDIDILVVGCRIDPREQDKLIKQLSGYENVNLIAYPDVASELTLRNRAAKKAVGNFLLFIRTDLEFSKGSQGLVKQMLERADGPTVGAVGCLQIDAKKRIRHAGLFQLPGHSPALMYYGHLIKKAIRFMGTRTYPYDLRKSRPVLAAVGALLVSRHHFREAGGFKESPSADTDMADLGLCLWLNRRGWQSWYQAGGHLIVEPANKRLALGDGLVISTAEPSDEAAGHDPFLPKLTATNLPKPRYRVRPGLWLRRRGRSA